MEKIKSRRTYRLLNKAGRGTTDDITAQLKAFEELYEDFHKSIEEKTEEEKKAFIEHFNGLDIEDHDEIGTALASGDVGTWR